MMRFSVASSPRAVHQLTHQSAMLAGLRALGVEAQATLARPTCPTKHVACWGWRLGERYHAAGAEVLVMERGYLGDRFAWTSLGWNGLNGRAQFPEIKDNGQRFRENFAPMKPWKSGGDYVLLMGQVPGDMSLRGRDLRPWYDMAATQAQNSYELPVKFRPHPLAAKRGFSHRPIHSEPSKAQDLAEALDGAAFCVTFNSNSGVDAVLAGVPTVCIDQGSMAWDVSSHRIGDIYKPSRDNWANQLAWKQWRIEEIQTGEALKPLLAMNGNFGADDRRSRAS